MESIGGWLSSSSDDGEQSEFRIQRRNLRGSSNPLDLNDEVFKELFRLSKESFIFVRDHMRERFPVSIRSTRISVENKLAATLRFLAHGSYQACVGQDFLVAMAQPTVSQSMAQTIDIMEDVLCPLLITLNMTAEERIESKNWFYERSKIPSVIGAIDGCHIGILRPKDNEHLFYNRKGYHSINAMIICDHKMRIRSVTGNYGGASHDSAVWSMSQERSFIKNICNTEDRNSWLLGDSGYPLEPWLLTPYRSAANGSAEAKFNHYHAKGRNIIERTFGVLKGRFRCLSASRKLNYAPQKAAKILNVCCALHNLCIKFNITLNDNEHEASDNVSNSIGSLVQNEDLLLNDSQRARKIRDEIRNSLV